VTVIDTNKARVEHIGESYDVMSILGNGSSITTLSEAGVEEADVFIAVTGSDELNLLCCMFAKKAGHCHAIARVRNPSYSHELDFIKKQIGISAIINPEMAAAKEISHLLRFPGASKIDTFAGGRVRLIKFALTEQQGLDGVAIHEITTRLKSDILVCAVERTAGSSSPTVTLCCRTATRSPSSPRRRRPTSSSSVSICRCGRCATPSSWAAVPSPIT
jgi:trk system potassium uptake protein TrkA